MYVILKCSCKVHTFVVEQQQLFIAVFIIISRSTDWFGYRRLNRTKQTIFTINNVLKHTLCWTLDTVPVVFFGVYSNRRETYIGSGIDDI